MSKLLVSLLFAASLCACAGVKVPLNRVSSLYVGMTAQDVVRLMGKPYSVTTRSDGVSIYVWVHVNLITGNSESMALPMKNGLLAAVPASV